MESNTSQIAGRGGWGAHALRGEQTAAPPSGASPAAARIARRSSLPAPSYRLRATGFGLRASGFGLQATGYGLQATGSLAPSSQSAPSTSRQEPLLVVESVNISKRHGIKCLQNRPVRKTRVFSHRQPAQGFGVRATGYRLPATGYRLRLLPAPGPQAPSSVCPNGHLPPLRPLCQCPVSFGNL